jgi:undecaprenyl-diphosphatase
MVADLMKVSIGLSRPDSHLWLIHASKPTFPSGHAANSMIVYLSIALLLTRMGAIRLWLVAAALLLSGLIGISRVELGVHWPTDVVAGWSFGAAWALLWCSAAFKLGNSNELGEV